MKLILVTPVSIRYIPNGDLTINEDETIKSWLQQWTVPKSYKQVVTDLDTIIEQNDPCKLYAKQFLEDYRSIVKAKPDLEAVAASFKFRINVTPLQLNVPFYQGGSFNYIDSTVADMAAGGIINCLQGR